LDARSDGTVKQDAFMPPPDLQLSVTRHVGLSQEMLWRIGLEVVREVGATRSAALIGRADLTASSIMSPLAVEAAPLPSNRNHAHIIGWPNDKPAQNNLAQRLAAIAEYTSFTKPE
jgi:hypothetical protein